mmetsp:Transcript_73248/g.203173  ORF Transcript_73248/g.203173 Transcript_73248/m.203173 type:complete len:1379 (-) Transcript_73248:301-4437(-)
MQGQSDENALIADLFRQLDRKPAGPDVKKQAKQTGPEAETKSSGMDSERSATGDDAVGKPPSLGRLVLLSKREWPALFRAVLVSVLCIAVDSLAPEVKAIMDDLLLYPDLEEESIYGIVHFELSGDRKVELRRFTMITIALRCVSMVLGIVKGITFGLVAARVVTRMRLQLFSSLLSHEIGFFDGCTSGELSSRLGSDAEAVQFMASGALPDVTLALVKIAVLIAMMFAQSHELCLLLLALLPCMLLYAGIFTPIMIKLNKSYQDAVAKSSDIATQSIGNFKLVRAFGAESFVSRLYTIAVGNIGGRSKCPCSWWPEPVRNIYRIGVFRSLFQQIVIQGTICIGATGFAAITWYAYNMIIEERITYGTVGAFTTYGLMIMAQCAILGRAVYAIGPAMGASQRIFAIIDRKPQIAADVGLIPPTMKGDIAFENVCFAYPTRPDVEVLTNVSFAIPARAKAAIVGSSGAGKSTTLLLLERLYDVSAGRVLVDGQDVRTLNAQWLRRRLGSVQQEPVLFGFSIRVNIEYGRMAAAVAEGVAEPDEEDIVEAAKKANAHEFIMSFPDGYDTLVGERGMRLSGGQKQSIAIARTILCDPTVLLLDEATSALDGESEFFVQQALDRMMADRTVLVVAHRLSTVVDADLIMVMTKKGIAATGGHEQLLESCMIYRELVQNQLEKKDVLVAPESHAAVDSSVATAAEGSPPALSNDRPNAVGVSQSSDHKALAVGAPVELDYKRLEQIVLQNDTDATKKREREANDKAGKKTRDTAPRAPCGFLLKLIGPEMPVLIFAVLLTLCSTVTEAYLPLLQGECMDYVLGDYDVETKKFEARRIMIIVLVAGVAIQVVQYLRVAISSLASERVVARTRLWVFEAIFKQDMAFFDTQTTGDLTSRLVSDSQMVQMAAASSCVEVVIGLVKGVIGLAMSFAVSWRLALLTVACFAAVGIVFLPLLGPAIWLHQKYQAAVGRSVNVSTEVTGSMRTVISFGSERFMGMLYGAAVGQLDGPSTCCWWPLRSQSAYRYSVFKSVATRVALQVALCLCTSLGSLVMWYAYTLILKGELSFGQIYSFTMFAFAILQGFAGAAGGLAGLTAALGALGRIYEIWKREPAVPTSGGQRLEGLAFDVTFEGVGFAYPARSDVQVLQGISLTVPADTSAALVGTSGCGKSTMLQLIARFYDVGSGVIRLGGRDVRELDASWMRRRIGVVQQEPILFGFDVRSNIAYGRNAMHLIEGRPLPSQVEIEQVAKAANAHGFVSELPERYATLVGERGVLLSGGQKQRVAIARALLMEPKLLLLDEATSALDAESEHLVQEAIDRAAQDRTVIIVAHRLSTVRDVDRIFVMDGGQIVDSGKHHALLDSCERYRELVGNQDRAGKRHGQ